ncbi:M56 family metallopeptidase [Flavobacterium artemisiae]|uniref:M56 family metallopeptidase n=1 Tax=Flavobacterium artemisiae TaxID=2126556 RepID=A0ABW4HE22_9FLAO
MIDYLLKSGILLFGFYAVYKIMLENEKMFRFNRAYLLGSLIFSLVIPLQLFSVQSLFSDKISVMQLDGIVIRTSTAVSDSVNFNQIFWFGVVLVYAIVAIILTVRFFKNLYAIYRISKNNKSQIIENKKVVLVKNTILPFSFWNAIFINKEDFENGRIPTELIAHEKAHLVQRHSLDILFVEILQIIFWFNPLIVFFEKAIKLNHEFLADEAVNNQFKEVSNYQNLLLHFASNKGTVALASNINYLITKKRFLMMSKKESLVKSTFKICGVFIFCGIMLLVFSEKTTAQSANSTPMMKNGFSVNYDTESVNEPQYPGGIQEFYKFVGENFKIPEEASKNKVDVKIYMEFMVEKDGSLSEFKATKGDVYGIGNEAIRILKLSPKWIPATQEGKPVRVLYNLPILIQSAK